MAKTIHKSFNVMGTNVAVIEIKKGTKIYDNGSCIQVAHHGHWYTISQRDWSAIQANFSLEEEKDTSVTWNAWTYTIIDSPN